MFWEVGSTNRITNGRRQENGKGSGNLSFSMEKGKCPEIERNMNIQIKKEYKGFCLDVKMQEESKRIGILGASGCGKSMLLKSVAGIVTPDFGRIEINQRILFDTNQKINLTPQKRRVGYLFQNYALFPNMTVRENIAAGVSGSKAQRTAIVQDAIERFRLRGLENRYPSQLSGGQQQRVALARIMVYRPDVILLDEPFSAMDFHLKLRLQEELREMTADYEGMMILVSHSRDEIYSFSDRIWIMDHGKFVCSGDTKTVFHSPENRIAASLTGCKNILEVERLDEYHVFARELNTVLTLEKSIPQNIKAIGYRAHDFVPVWGAKEENCIPVKIRSIVELPFETNLHIRTEGENHIVWMVQREGKQEMENRGYPPFLKMLQEKMLLLTG